MNTLTAYGRLLEASADDRTLTYKLLPYGEAGRTSLGKVTASAGTLTLPDSPDALVANMEHDRTRPVARAVTLDETDDGLTASFRVASTSTGNDLLAEATEGLRTGISVELDDPVIRDGKLLGGTLTGAGFVTEPAFPSAQLVAADAGELPDETRHPFHDTVDAALAEQAKKAASSAAANEDPSPDNEDPSQSGEDHTTEDTESEESEEEPTVNASTAASAPADLRASAAGGGALLAADSKPQDLYELLAQAGRTRDQKLTAALADVTQTDVIGVTETPQWVGELWDGRAYQRRYIPLFSQARLTSFKVNGWRWTTKPTVGAYSGDKNEVPSNSPATAAVEIEAERIAGGHDIDRKYRDFGDTGFWQSYLAAMNESYAMVSDEMVLTDVLAAATQVQVGDNPGNVPDVWVKIIDGVLAVYNATNALASGVVLSTELYRQFLLTPQEGGLEYLNAALGIESGTAGGFRVVPSSLLAADESLAVAREAATVHELGGSPIRVEAENIANGGIDVGLFGYLAVNIHDSEGLALVSDNGGGS